jgi:hypothetical protein
MPASAAQVFGPVTVDPGFNTTGEKTLLTMATTLPAGGKNVIIVFVEANGQAMTNARGTLRIKKGTTILYGDLHTFRLNYARGYAYIAVDDSPTGSDTYVVTVNVVAAGSSSSAVHVQGIVIKTDDANWAFNATAVNISAGATATVVSLTTSYPVGSKVVAVMILDGYRSDGSSGHTNIGAGSIRLKLGTTVLTSSPHAIGSHAQDQPGWWILLWGGIVSTSTQTWGIEVYNNSTPAVPYAFFGEIVTFTVSDLAFLDSASSTLSTTSLTTVGNVTTTLTGDVAVLAVPSGENPSSTSYGTAFSSGYIVLQKNNDPASQVTNLVAQYLGITSDWSRSQVFFLARVDTAVSNPSYQVKMQAGWSGINGQAKILAFVLLTGLQIKRVFGETVRETEGSIFRRGRFRISAESVNLSELGRVARNLVRIPLEAVNLVESMVRARIRVRVIGEAERISEAFRALRDRIRQVLEGLSVSEAIARSRRRFRAIAENVLLSEAILRARRMAKIVGETVRSLESAVRSRVIIRLVSEVVRISEAFNSFGGRVKAVIEGLQLSEDVRWSRSLGRVVPEQIRVSESISKAVRFVKILGETVNLPEAFRAVRSRFRSVSESLRISEVVTHFKGTVRVVGEVLNLGELSRVVRNRFKQVGEAVNIGEVFVRVRVVVKAVLEPISILEVRLVSQSMTRVIGAIVNIGETVVRFKGRVLDITERVNVVEFKLFKTIKTYIDRLVSTLRGMAKGGKF